MVTLEPITKEDLSFILDIRNHYDTRHWLNDNRDFYYHEIIDWFNTKHPEWYIVYDENKHKVGYVRTSNKTIYNSIYIGCDIHPDKRRRGYGFQALTEVIKMYRSQGINIFYLGVYSDNERAINLYKKLGFVTIEHKEQNERPYELMELKYEI